MADRPSIESLRDICMVNLCSEDEAAMNAALSELAAYREREECIAIPEDGVPEHLWLRVGPAAYMALRAERDALKAELERERIRLAACGVLAQSNTPESLARNRVMEAAYWSASADDVCRAVEREMAERARADALAARVEALRPWAAHLEGCSEQENGPDTCDCGLSKVLRSTPPADLEAHDARVRREALEGAWERVKLHNHNPTGYINVNVIRNAIRGEAIVECGCHLDHKARAAAILGPEAQDNEQETK